jgi:hypothetical protein
MSENDESKRIILSRRARFIAAGLASVSLAANAACESEAEPQACLSYYTGGASGTEATDGGPDGNDGPGGLGGLGGFGGGPSDAANEPDKSPIDATDV